MSSRERSGRLVCGILALAFLASATSRAQDSRAGLISWIEKSCPGCSERMRSQTGVFVLEKGEEALLARAWLAERATRSIDVQYFIWSTDNIGTLAAEALLRAAERGVRVRVLVDDFLIDAEDQTLLALTAHPKVQIKIYNPKSSLRVSLPRRIANLITNFRGVNQRMHDKTAIFDGIAGITGGRNMADEYFDYDRTYNFRDRDVLLLGQAVSQMEGNFEEFWVSRFAVAVPDLLSRSRSALSVEEIEQTHTELQQYAKNPTNYSPTVRAALDRLPERFGAIADALVWEDVEFISDVPGKNANRFFLGGGGEITDRLRSELEAAQESVLIQSPYLIVPEGGLELFSALTQRGVRVRISTNSLASTDNLYAFSGYHKQREELLAAGVEIFEYKPSPEIQTQLIERPPELDHRTTTFALHAKSMVIDRRRLYVGTFNLDPRSANLNTEVGILVTSDVLGEQVARSIEADLRPENSWRVSFESNPDGEVPLRKRLRLWGLDWLPLDGLL